MWKIKSAILIFLLTLSTPSKATSLELALVLDGSGSVSASDYQLQLDGYLNAFTSASFYSNYVANSIYDEIYLSAWQFSSTVIEEVGWTLIDSQAAATSFGNLFNTTDMAQLGGLTYTDVAIDAVVTSMAGNGIEGTLIMDISTDGVATDSAAALLSADNARSAGVTINAIGVGSIDASFLSDLVGIGSGSAYSGFYLTASDFTEFGTALDTKLEVEVTGVNEVPGPASIGFFSAGLLFLGSVLRRRKKA